MENLPQPDRTISPETYAFLLRAAEYAVDHLNGSESPESVLFLRTAIAKVGGND